MSKTVRVCSTETCKSRLPDFAFDGHSRCSVCIGFLCSRDKHCEECSQWTNDRFDKYIKHRHVLELNRARKAKQRAKAKQLPVPLTTQQAVGGSAHSISPSPSASVADISYSSSVSPYTPSALTQSLPSSSPSAVVSGPSDQVVTRSEFDNLKSLMATMAADLAALRKDSSQVHSVSDPPPSQAVSSNSVVDRRDRDSLVNRPDTSLVEGRPVPMEESRPTKSCPMTQSGTDDRSRKRDRESKDSASRVKRQRPPSRSREATPTHPDGGLRHRLSQSPASSRGIPSGLGNAVSTPLPQGAPSSSHADGTFSESMMLTLQSLVADSMKVNPSLSLPQAVSLAKSHLKEHDPLNLSYSSARSGRGSSVRREVASALSYERETPKALDLSSGSGGLQEGVTSVEVHLDAGSHSLGHGQARLERVTGFSHSTPISHSVSAKSHSQVVTSHDVSSHSPAPAFSLVKDLGVSIQAGGSHAFQEPVTLIQTAPLVTSNPLLQRVSHTSHSEVLVQPISKDLSQSFVSNVSVESVHSQDFSAGSFKVKSRSPSLSRHATPVSDRSALPSPAKKVVTSPRKPVLSIQTGPSVSFPPKPRTLSWSPIEIVDFPPATVVDQATLVKPRRSSRGTQTCFDSVDKSVGCSLGTLKGSSPSISSPVTPEPPALAATQGHSSSSLPGRPVSSKETATRGLSSISVSSSVPHSDIIESEDESDSASVVLEDSDPETELLSASESYNFLKTQIVGKYSFVKSEKKVVERSSFQAAFERVKPKPSLFRLTPSVKLRLAALDQELLEKKASSSSVTVFPPFLKNRDFRYYLSDVTPDFDAQTSVLASMAGVLDQSRVKRLKKTKVAFKLTELDSIFKSAFRALEIWSYASSSFEVLGDCFLDLKEKLPAEHHQLAIKYASLLRCVDKAGRHGIGETANIVTNLMLKKREHIMSLSNASVPLSTKTDVIFAPVSSLKLLPPDVVKTATTQFRQQTETSALVAVAAASKASTSKSFKASDFGRYYPSPLQSKFRGGRVRGVGKNSRRFFLRNREYFNRRDRASRGRGQGNRNQNQPPPPSNQ